MHSLGIRIAVDDINRSGGLLGKKVELIEGEHGGKSSETVRVTRDLVDQKVAAVIGDNTTGITKLAATVCQDNNVVLISPTASGSGVVEMGDYIFRIALPAGECLWVYQNRHGNSCGQIA